MSSSGHEPNPERLIEGELGPLLEDANREFTRDIDQVAAFQRVTERLSTSRMLGLQRSYWLVPAALLLAAGFVTLTSVVRRARLANGPSVAAEDLHGFHFKLATAPSATTDARVAVERGAPSLAEGQSASGAKSNAQRTNSPAFAKSALHATARGVTESAERASTDLASADLASADLAPAVPSGSQLGGEASAAPASARAGTSTSATSATSAAPDCLSLARRGQTRDAEACFLKRAEESGLGAEMALYEVARLRRDVLADAAGALAALAEYRTRFPAGSLRREADMSQLELLLQLGRTDEALKQSDELLSSSSSGERAAELHLLRGHILRKAQSRFAEAAREYELAERAGERGGDSTYFRALCLEALGQAPEAAALFAKYLEQPQRAYVEDARRRLQRLKP